MCVRAGAQVALTQQQQQVAGAAWAGPAPGAADPMDAALATVVRALPDCAVVLVQSGAR